MNVLALIADMHIYIYIVGSPHTEQFYIITFEKKKRKKKREITFDA